MCLGSLAALFALGVHAKQCVAHSPAHTLALVELYTGEACSGCSPADRWLSSVSQSARASEHLVAVVLHVDHRHYEPEAAREVPVRKRRLTPLQRMALAYPPQVLLQGRDFRAWATPAFGHALARINAAPARARLTVEITAMNAGSAVIRGVAELVDASQVPDAVVYLAAYEDRGRNVVLEWQGPIGFSGPRLALARELPLLPQALPGRSGVVGFVHNRRAAEVLQALMLPACP